MHPRLIGFCGLKGSGKDTAAGPFLHAGWQKVAFAQTLKDMVHVLLRARGCHDPERYTDGDRKEFATPYLMNRTARHVMQTLGTEFGRDQVHPDLWIDTWRIKVSDLLEAGEGVVVTDIRFQNEADAIKKLGGRVFRVVRPRLTNGDLHASETGVANIDATAELLNNFPTARDFQVHIHDRFF